MTEVHLIYRSPTAGSAVVIFDDRGQLKLFAVWAGQIAVVVRHVAVNGIGVVIHILDFDSERETINTLERLCFFLPADANSNGDLFTFELDANGFRYVSKNFTLRWVPAGIFLYLFKKQIRVQLVGVEEPVADIDLRQRVTVCRSWDQ